MSFSKIDCCGFCKAVSGERLKQGMTTMVFTPSSNPATLTVLRGSISESSGSTAFCLTGSSGILRAAGGAALMGAGGTVQFTYEAVGMGSSPVELTYSRPWEPQTATNRTFKITVNVSH